MSLFSLRTFFDWSHLKRGGYLVGTSVRSQWFCYLWNLALSGDASQSNHLDLSNLRSKRGVHSGPIDDSFEPCPSRYCLLFHHREFYFLLCFGLHLLDLVCADIWSVRHRLQKRQTEGRIQPEQIIRTGFTDYLLCPFGRSYSDIHRALRQRNDSNATQS